MKNLQFSGVDGRFWSGGVGILLVGVLFQWNPVLLGQEPTTPAIETRADQVLQEMSAYLGNARRFGFEVEESFDELTEAGLMIQYANVRRIGVRRPDGLVGEVSGDTSNRNFWYDGQSVVLLDKVHNVYTRIENVPSSITGLLDTLAEEYGVVLPTADLLYEDVYASLIGAVDSGVYVGLHNVGGVKAHHLAFSQELVDWQIWIEAGSRPIPRKIVITYTEEPGQPQFEAVITRWREPLELPDATFVFVAPAGATEVAIPGQTP